MSFADTISNLGLNTATPTPSTSNKSGTLGQADFLKLMTAQMKYQDPFKPVDNTQMVGQMAQFSSLSGISEMTSTLKAIQDKLGQTSVADAASYIGRSVLTEGDVAYGTKEGALAGAIELDKPATDVTVTIKDKNGAVLKTIPLGKQTPGTIEYEWDGKTADGTAAGVGPFKIEVSAKDDKGSVPARGLVWAPVQSVTMSSKGEAVLSVAGLGQVPARSVRQIG